MGLLLCHGCKRDIIEKDLPNLKQNSSNLLNSSSIPGPLRKSKTYSDDESIHSRKLNDKDIFGNNLIFYVVQSRASRCFDLLLKDSYKFGYNFKIGNNLTNYHYE